MKFKIGDKVKFDEDRNGTRVGTEYFTSYIPDYYIKHGSLLLNIEEYKKNHAQIVDKYSNYLIVRYCDVNNKFVQLGFLPENLIPVKINWRERLK